MTEYNPHGPEHGSQPNLNQQTRLQPKVDQELPLRDETFADARKRPKLFRPDTVTDMMNEPLPLTPTETTPAIKIWLDQFPADASDQAFTNNPEAIKHFHGEVTDLITNNLKVYVADQNPAMREYISDQKEAYLKGLKRKDAGFNQKVDAFASGQLVRGLAADSNFGGFEVGTMMGPVDLTDRQGRAKILDTRPNITRQTEAVGAFIHWETDKRTAAKAHNQGAEFTQRIYLNPASTELVGVFETVMQNLNAQGFEAHGKILDRSVEGITRLKRPADERTNRADGIVLYATQAEAERVLQEVLRIAKASPAAFRGRPVPRITQKLGDGIAVGDEPTEKNTSLTSHRAELLSDAIQAARADLNLQAGEDVPEALRDQAYLAFTQRLSQLARTRGVSAQNLSFNA